MPCIRGEHQEEFEDMEQLSPVFSIRGKHSGTDSVSHTLVCTNQGQEQPSGDYTFGSLGYMNSQDF